MNSRKQQAEVSTFQALLASSNSAIVWNGICTGNTPEFRGSTHFLLEQSVPWRYDQQRLQPDQELAPCESHLWVKRIWDISYYQRDTCLYFKPSSWWVCQMRSTGGEGKTRGMVGIRTSLRKAWYKRGKTPKVASLSSKKDWSNNPLWANLVPKSAWRRDCEWPVVSELVGKMRVLPTLYTKSVENGGDKWIPDFLEEWVILYDIVLWNIVVTYPNTFEGSNGILVRRSHVATCSGECS